MSTLRLGIAVALLTLMSVAASAQVGVRIGGFGIGLGIPTQPLVRERPDSAERYRGPQRTERAQRRRHDDDDDVKTAKKTPANEDSKAESENSSIVSVEADDKPGKSNSGTSSSENSSIVSIAGDKDSPGKLDTAAFSNENSTIANANVTADADLVKGQLKRTTETDGSGKVVATCKRYFPTVGQTISVPCE